MALNMSAVETRVKEIESAISQSLANHNALLGALSEAKNMLHMMSELADAVAPDSVVADVIDAVEQIVDAVS
jgi:hypothetical protein